MNSALFHFVWQGAAIALVLAIALIFVKSARARYSWACAALLAMPVALVVTLMMSLPPERPLVRVPVFFIPPSHIDAATSASAAPVSIDPTSLWMAGVALLYGYRLIGWLAAQRLRRRGVCAASSDWQLRVAQLSARLRMTRPVALLESALAETPMTIGLWRPVILMPLGLLAGLPSAQVEAIFLHELAHIRRHDYLVNLLQAVVEGLLFYHPATWWVSHVIRREREMCCDDLAVAATGDPLTYTQALAALEEHRVRVPVLAVTGGPLMFRIHRLLGQPSRFSPAPALVFFTLATGAALFAFQPEPAPLPEPVPAPQPAPDPAPTPIAQQEPDAQTPAVAQPTPKPERDLVAEYLSRTVATPFSKWVNQEVAWIITVGERGAFERLRTDDERQFFIEQFWFRRDPTPETIVNEYKEEHYRRLAWADGHFREHGSTGWISDRGMIYIKYGPPDEKEEQTADPSAYAHEKWHYRYLEGIGNDVVIGFVDELGTGVFRMSWDEKVRNAIQREQGTGPLMELQLIRELRMRMNRLQ